MVNSMSQGMPSIPDKPGQLVTLGEAKDQGHILSGANLPPRGLGGPSLQEGLNGICCFYLPNQEDGALSEDRSHA